MKSHRVTVPTPSHQALVPITDKVAEAVGNLGIEDGVAHIFVLHTTCGLLINENADPDVARDILRRLEELVPWENLRDRHAEGNTAAHVRSSLVGSSLTIPVQGGSLVLGAWQGVFLAEFDGPRTRQVVVTAV
ncbi:MAG: YjbQ family protein [Nitrospirae bacterium]|nr:YjbQ family protein [Nitrospirota bacterium]